MFPEIDIAVLQKVLYSDRRLLEKEILIFSSARFPAIFSLRNYSSVSEAELH